MTFGILSFWIDPYHQAARAEFYENLVNPNAAEEPSATSSVAVPEMREEAAPAATAEEESVSDGFDSDSKEDEPDEENSEESNDD